MSWSKSHCSCDSGRIVPCPLSHLQPDFHFHWEGTFLRENNEAITTYEYDGILKSFIPGRNRINFASVHGRHVEMEGVQ